MKTLRTFYKLILLLIVFLGFTVFSLFNRVRAKRLEDRRRLYIHTMSFFSNLALRVLNFKVTGKNIPSTKNNHYLLVGNHLGMLDILITSSLCPTLFITSVDIRESLGIGTISELGGCLYVERRDRANIKNEIKEIRAVLNQGFNVVLYPESKTSDGSKILPFKKTLMTAAAGSGASILPMVLNYRKINDEAISGKWRDHVCWYGDQAFLPAILRSLSLKSCEVDLEFLNPIQIHSEEERKHIAETVQRSIEEKFNPIM